ncbi:MAG: alpha-galactosidase [Chlorobi bacterium]|nr:alpha-galactosidase [Chlorobiota bacterium]
MEYQGDWSTDGPAKVSKDALVFTYPAERCYGSEGPHRIDRNEPLSSYWFLSVHDPVSRNNSVWGVFSIPTGLVRFKVTPMQSLVSGSRVLRWKYEIDCHSGGRGVRLPAGSTLRLGQIYIGTWKGSHYRGMARFAEELSRSMKRALSFRNVSGWCSWYAGYRDEITEEDCMANLEAMQEYPGMACFQVDDGWMKSTGDAAGIVHEANVAKFPGGMDGFAKKLRHHDKMPGIWVRPFRATGQSNTPVNARQHCLDLSRPETRILLRDLMQRVCSGWGYEYVKMDFLTYDFFGRWGMELEDAATHTFQPYDDSLTNIQMYRLGLEALREGAGDERFLLGCNCLVGPALGIVDGFRIGDDIDAENWDRTYTMGVRAVAPMHFLNGRTWWNDPDCIVVHEPMDLRHVIQWASLVAVNGGMGMVSSKLMDIPDESRDILRKVLPVLNLDLQPLDLDRDNVARDVGRKGEIRKHVVLLACSVQLVGG